MTGTFTILTGSRGVQYRHPGFRDDAISVTAMIGGQAYPFLPSVRRDVRHLPLPPVR